jgi:hypothetical protein
MKSKYVELTELSNIQTARTKSAYLERFVVAVSAIPTIQRSGTLFGTAAVISSSFRSAAELIAVRMEGLGRVITANDW